MSECAAGALRGRWSTTVCWPLHDAGMHAQLRADQDVDLSYHVRGVWMPEEASVEVLVDSLRVYQTDQRCLS